MKCGNSSVRIKKYGTKLYQRQLSAYKEAFALVDELSPEQVDEFKEAFGMFDPNKSGLITKEGIATAMKSLGQNPTENELVEMMKEADLNGSGSIDFLEFLTMMAKKLKDAHREDELRELFRIFDKDGSGNIDADEVRHVLITICGEKLTSEEVKELMKEADIDGNGEIDYQDFVMLMTKQ